MSVETYAGLLLDVVKQHGFDGIPPARRRRLADILRYVADRAEPKPPPPKNGVLSQLNNGSRAE